MQKFFFTLVGMFSFLSFSWRKTHSRQINYERGKKICSHRKKHMDGFFLWRKYRRRMPNQIFYMHEIGVILEFYEFGGANNFSFFSFVDFLKDCRTKVRESEWKRTRHGNHTKYISTSTHTHTWRREKKKVKNEINIISKIKFMSNVKKSVYSVVSVNHRVKNSYRHSSFAHASKRNTHEIRIFTCFLLYFFFHFLHSCLHVNCSFFGRVFCYFLVKFCCSTFAGLPFFAMLLVLWLSNSKILRSSNDNETRKKNESLRRNKSARKYETTKIIISWYGIRWKNCVTPNN